MRSRVIAFIILVQLLLSSTALGENSIVIAQPGDSGVDVEIVLAKCKELGFIENLPSGADEYTERYLPDITRMEQALCLKADGIIDLDEFLEIETAIAVGSRGEIPRQMLERLYDLGYIKNILPLPHTVYEAQYQTIVKNLEKKLGLTADGILTRSERKRIEKEPLPDLQEIKNLNAKYINGGVTLSWTAVKGAVQYIVYRGGTEIGKTDKPPFEDYSIEMNHRYSYTVKAASYNKLSKTSNTKMMEIPFVQNMTFVQRGKPKYATLTSGRTKGDPRTLRFSTDNELSPGNTVRVHSITQQHLNNSCTRFTVILSAPKGYRLYVFNPPNGTVLDYASKESTTSNIESIQFDISDYILTKIGNEITINIFKSEKNRFWVFFHPQDN